MSNLENAPNGERKSDEGAASKSATGSFTAKVEKVGGSAQHAWSTTRDSVSELRDRLDLVGRVDRNPFGMVAAAMGVGYVLGGGIFSPLTGRLVSMALKLALRAAAIPFIKDELMTLVESASGASDEGNDDGSSGRRRSRQQAKNTNQGRQP